MQFIIKNTTPPQPIRSKQNLNSTEIIMEARKYRTGTEFKC